MEREGFSPIPKNLQFRVGLLLGLTLMLAAGFVLYTLYARGVFEATQRLTLLADNAEGVSLGMDVTFSGFPIGRVQRISLGEDGRARIDVDIPRRDSHWLRASSIFTLERGVVGPARIRAFTGNLQDAPLPDGAERAVLRGDTQEEIPRMVASLRSALENVERLTGPGGSLQASIDNLHAASERLAGRHGLLAAVLGSDADARKVLAAVEQANALLAKLGGVARRVDDAVARTDERLLGAGGVAEGAQRAVEGAQRTMQAAQRAAEQANVLLEELRASVQQVDRVLADAQAVSGNARAATTDLAALRAEVDASVRRLSTLIEDVNRRWPFQPESEIRLP
ncbi:MAG TPA: MlaD family protein [Burkholderiales bacterium]|nr:MlaD family protein [Burkholderiales bacterium]